MERIDEIIEKLPPEFRPLAKRYVPILIEMSFEELTQWVRFIVIGNWQIAYARLVGKMSTDEQVAELKRVNEMLVGLNEENASAVRIQRNIVQELLLVSIQMLGTLIL